MFARRSCSTSLLVGRVEFRRRCFLLGLWRCFSHHGSECLFFQIWLLGFTIVSTSVHGGGRRFQDSFVGSVSPVALCCCNALISDSSRSVEICSFVVVGAASVSSSFQDLVAAVLFCFCSDSKDCGGLGWFGLKAPFYSRCDLL
ncbi:hypothetical protein A2U01_0009147 [Trifolium medium]|uniref:Uncharacterized protein n=1 Tax=Trifolium medium TaxID=97028 RepID=A0A392MM32_9FABA|nr:hypothetical protein [Trifolium medium]